MRHSEFEREPFDLRAYEERIQTGPCFICEMVANRHGSLSNANADGSPLRDDLRGGESDGNYIVYQDDRAIVFLNKYPTLYGYTLVAPRGHRVQVTGDFTINAYLDL